MTPEAMDRAKVVGRSWAPWFQRRAEAARIRREWQERQKQAVLAAQTHRLFLAPLWTGIF